MKFKEYFLVEMAKLVKSNIPIDDYDIKYLKQFPNRFWMQALEYRYGKLLKDNVDQDGKLINNTSNINVEFKDGGRPNVKLRINPYISQLYEKIKKSGITLNKDSSGEFLYYSPMSRSKTNEVVRRLRNGSSNIIFSPNRVKSMFNTIDDPTEELTVWRHEYDEIKNKATIIANNCLNNLKNINSRLHINYYYWKDKIDDLVNLGLNRVRNNLANPHYNINNDLPNYYYNTVFQNGILSRRLIDKAKNLNIDIINLYLNHGMDSEMLRTYMSNIGPKPLGRRPALNPTIDNKYKAKNML